LKIVRFAAQGRVRYGVLRDGGLIEGLRRSPFARFGVTGFQPDPDGTAFNLDEVRLLAPCRPSKLVCLGLNYRSHVPEIGLPVPEVPLIFLKPSTAVIGPEDSIVLPPDSRRVDYEGELGVVIGRKTRAVPLDRALEYVPGYTCFNDISERHAQKDDVQWTRAKGYDTFAPTGPCIETELDPGDVQVETRLNGELRQSASTRDLIFGVPKLVSFISGVMTLLPGDVIATGTPSGVGRMNAGDVVEVTIGGVGTLRNTVVDHSTAVGKKARR
jgi:2-keto-4-pentenoate hydratase/2-oxohepta-3-ene-1,7-dioic acid hydratase in catechol pathway